MPRRERERTAEQLLGGAVRAGRLRSCRGEVEVLHAVVGVVGTQVVVREQLGDSLVVALLREERLGDASVVGGSAAMEDALIRDLAHDRTLEAELEAVVHVRRGSQQLGDDELGERARHRGGIGRGRPQQVGREREADDRGFLEHEPGRVGKRVDAGLDQLLHGARDLDAVGVADQRPLSLGLHDDAFVHERQRNLLRESGIAVGAGRELCGQLRRHPSGQQRAAEARRCARWEERTSAAG